MGIFGLSLPSLEIEGDFDAFRPDESIPTDLYGLLPQLQWYGGSACFPTAVTNALAGMAAWYEKPELLVNGADQHTRLLNTRLSLGTALGTTSNGTSKNQYLSGINQYYTEQGLDQDFSVTWTEGGLSEPTFNTANQVNVFAELVAAFARGPVIFHDAYTAGGGHALTGVALELNDINSNMQIDRGEAYAVIIDPLNPTKDYFPNSIDRAALSDEAALELWNTTIQAGPNARPFLQRVEIYQDFDRAEYPGALTFDYEQTALLPSATTGITAQGQLLFSDDNIWSTATLTNETTGNIYGFVGLQQSALQDNLHEIIAPKKVNEVIFDFTAFISGGQVSAELFSYFNESSDFANDLSFYQLADAQGAILDPITGARLAPGDIGYREAALRQAQIFEASDTNSTNDDLEGRISQDAAQMGSFSFTLEALDGTALFAPIVTTSDGDVWTTFADANRDGQHHFRWSGGLSFQVEDLYGLGDGDFNDLQAVLTTLEINGIA